ncbi:hypothetical protein T552_01213 [Pneumocystis carinii B80]|uniref:Vezatin n=1 Tax=Pneumocystis carinii (strain B80) TaxID=1408658 RepID=A0A0W4ZLL1_PNEC8|nr:hypothetical protein T552_01213 [Pneumocystis carinii B80]KTW29258.1 hypothetical protein T552_01213 [Pneumocystis carinii B80]
MAETVIFKNTPLGDYIKDIKQGDDVESKIKSIFQSYYTSQVRQRSRKRRYLSSEMKYFSDKSYSLVVKVYSLFSEFLSIYLSETEKSQFIERFRYIICTSQLLNENISPSLYQPQQTSINDKKSKNILFGIIADDSLYWSISGIFIVVLALVTSWKLKSNIYGINRGVGYFFVFIISIIVAVFLYIYHFRIYSKYIQKRAIFFMKRFVDTSQHFDITINKTLSLIQEVELISRGYLLSSPLPPITRIEANSQSRRCKMLRLLLSTLLSQVFLSYNRTFSLLQTFYSKREFDTLQIMYNLPNSQDLDSLPSYFKEDHSDGLPYLKALFYTIHEKRRQCLVSLLSMSTSSLKNISSWGCIIDQLKSLSDLMSNFGNEIEESLENNERISELSASKTKTNGKNIKWNDYTRNIGVLLQVLRRFQAKLYILKEETNCLMQGDIDENIKDDFLCYYDSLKDDLKVLMEKWESGRNYLLKICVESDSQTPKDLQSNSQKTEDSNPTFRKSLKLDSNSSIDESRNNKALSEITNDWEISSPYSQCLQSSEETSLSTNEKEVVFETVSNNSELDIQLQKPTRAERIERIKKEREKHLKIKKDREIGMKVVSELKDVLGKRKTKFLNDEN